MRRPQAIAAILLALGISVIGSSAVLAKGGPVIATLDAPLPVDPAPGTTVKVAWTLTMTFDDGSVRPFLAEGVFLRLSPATGKPLEVAASSDRDGHFIATVTVPSGGLGTVAIGLHGLACTENGPCTRADETFRIASKPAAAAGAAEAGAAGAAGAARAAAGAAGPAAVQPSAAAAPPAAASQPVTAGLPDLTVVVLLVVVGIAVAGMALTLRGRGRPAAA